MAFVGMDPERIRKVAEQLRQSSHQLTMVNEAVQRLINDATGAWEGPDTLDFSDAWTGQHKLTLQQCVTQLEQMSTDAIEQIAQQEKASGITPGGPGSVLPPGTVIPGTTTPVAGLTPDELAEMDPDEAAKALAEMSPQEQAAVLAALDPQEAAAILDAMVKDSPSNAAAALAAMSPATRAAALAAMGGDQASAALQSMTPAQVDETLGAMTPEQLAHTIAASAVVDTVKAYVEGSAEVASWKIEGAADASYKVKADGSVEMTAHLEGGLGKSLDGAGMEGSVTAGLQAEYELKFSSVEEAEKFLDDLGGALTDLGPGDITDPAGAITDNVKDVFKAVDDQHVRFGGYLKGEVEGEVGEFAKGAGEARVDYTYDPTENEHALKFSATASLEADLDEGTSGKVEASVSAEVKVKDEQVSEITLKTSASGSMAADLMGATPESKASFGVGGDVTMTIKPGDPGFAEISEAVKSGDMSRATALAVENSTITYRETVTEELAHGEGDLSLKVPVLGTKLAGAEYEYGATAESATRVIVKPAGTHTSYDVTEGIR